MNTTGNLQENKQTQEQLWIEITVAFNDNFNLNLDPREVWMIFNKDWSLSKNRV